MRQVRLQLLQALEVPCDLDADWGQKCCRRQANRGAAHTHTHKSAKETRGSNPRNRAWRSNPRNIVLKSKESRPASSPNTGLPPNLPPVSMWTRTRLWHSLAALSAGDASASSASVASREACSTCSECSTRCSVSTCEKCHPQLLSKALEERKQWVFG